MNRLLFPTTESPARGLQFLLCLGLIWFVLEGTAAASCGDYVQIGGRMTPHNRSSESHLSRHQVGKIALGKLPIGDSLPIPCQGPHCGRGRPQEAPVPLAHATAPRADACLAIVESAATIGRTYRSIPGNDAVPRGSTSRLERPPRD